MERISQWPQNERPREKLLQLGAHALSDAELLAIFLRTGTKGNHVVDLARQLIKTFGSISGIYQATEQQFCQANGLGQAKYVQLQACLEMTKRYLAEDLFTSDALTSSQQTKDYLIAQLRAEKHEVFAMLVLDNQHQIIAFEKMFFGTIDAAAVYPRVLVEKVLGLHGAAVILCHNHPSGLASPSRADLQITERIKHALSLIDVTVLDHIIVAGCRSYSFAEHGKL
ncbi:DNA repair protein RadC [Thalassotalea sp. LPB0316]|uniref:RadC family protein n=1 Tax=Thalassotalea sp. LPB0316 TaxID=2769490 RepID=UPI0018688A3E|nr:DNA repair protein RadC [Thalassotalea sp. LPB0316]QOL26460.1 DNA repair protein RadC [Thalassotalea sp. LPB0316]